MRVLTCECWNRTGNRARSAIRNIKGDKMAIKVRKIAKFAEHLRLFLLPSLIVTVLSHQGEGLNRQVVHRRDRLRASLLTLVIVNARYRVIHQGVVMRAWLVRSMG